MACHFFKEMSVYLTEKWSLRRVAKTRTRPRRCKSGSTFFSDTKRRKGDEVHPNCNIQAAKSPFLPASHLVPDNTKAQRAGREREMGTQRKSARSGRRGSSPSSLSSFPPGRPPPPQRRTAAGKAGERRAARECTSTTCVIPSGEDYPTKKSRAPSPPRLPSSLSELRLNVERGVMKGGREQGARYACVCAPEKAPSLSRSPPRGGRRRR